MGNTLILRLTGVLQSWGERSHWNVRDTAKYPTKSGVVGLLGAALGTRDLASINRTLTMGVRVDKPGQVLRDYHTVISGVLDATGKIKINELRSYQTLVTNRFYLSDAAFMVALMSPDSGLIERLSAAVKSPVWPLYLGRRSCLPSAPIFVGVETHATLMEALRADGEYAYEIEGQGSLLRQDEITGDRVFAMRRVGRFVA